MSRITTDHKWKPLLRTHDLTLSDKAALPEISDMSERDLHEKVFVRYAGFVWVANDLMPTLHLDATWQEWDVFAPISDNSYMVIKFHTDRQRYVVGTLTE